MSSPKQRKAFAMSGILAQEVPFIGAVKGVA